MVKTTDSKTPSKKIAGYKIVVTGEYKSVDPSNGVVSIRYFDNMSFDLPEIVSYVDGRKDVKTSINGRETTVKVPNVKKANASRVGLHIIKKFYLDAALKKKYPDFKSVRTCSVFNKERCMIDEPASFKAENISDMTESELKQFVVLHDITIVLSSYGDLGNQKLAVKRAYQQKVKDNQDAGITPAMSAQELALTPEFETGEDLLR